MGAFAACWAALLNVWLLQLGHDTSSLVCAASHTFAGLGRDWEEADGGPGRSEGTTEQHAAERVDAAQAPQHSPVLGPAAGWLPVPEIPCEGGSGDGGERGALYRVHLHAPAATAGDGLSRHSCAGQQMCRPVSFSYLAV